MFSTIRNTARYTKAVATFLAWYSLARVGCLCDRQLASDWKAGARFDHVDDSLKNLEAIHVELFGTEE